MHLPLVLPPVVTGWLLLILFGIRGPIGSLLHDWFGIRLVFTTAGASLACAVMTFPVMVRAVRLSLEAADPGLEQAARTLGAGRLDRLFNVTLPLASPGILVGGIVGYATCLGEFGAVITFAANIPGQTQTLPLAIYTALQVPGGEAKAAELSLVSLTLGADRAAAVGMDRQAAERGAGPMSLAVRLRHRFPGGADGHRVRGALARGDRAVRSVGRRQVHHHRRRRRPAAPRCMPGRGRRPGAGRHRSRASGCRRNAGASAWCSRTRGCSRTCRSPPTCASACAGRRRVRCGSTRWSDLLGIGALLARRPHTLSGGERQRVAIGRALLAQPHLLLMDEPLASLDAARKAEILPYLTRLKTALRLPVLYVTHALDEATRLADSMVLLEAGRVVGSGTLSEVAARADLPLAQRDDAGRAAAVPSWRSMTPAAN